MNKKYLLTGAVVFLIALACHGQSARANSTNTNAWLMYFGNHKLGKKFGLHAEVQVRRNEGIKNWQQLLLRTGLDYYTSQVRFTVGYAFVETHPYGDFPVANAFPEHRIWQQALVANPVGKFKISHRYRLEQRFIGNSTTGEFNNGRYENRFRYMFRTNIPLKGETIEPHHFYIGLYDEIFANFGKEVGNNLLDQNRAYAALGYHLGKAGKIEIGYLYQMVQQRKLLIANTPIQNIIENNHTFQLAFISDIPFFSESK